MSTVNLTHHQPAADHASLVVVAAGLGFTAGLAAGSIRARARLRRLHLLLTHARHAAHHDPLTGLPNRTVVYDLLHHARPALVGLLDLDDLKTVNDRFGHATGDQLLRVVADRLAAAMTGRGTAARLGGDEIVLLWRRAPADPVTAAATTVLQQLTEPAIIGGRTLTPRASIGLAAAGPTLAGPHLLAAADAAMYEAKPRPDRVCLYQHDTPPAQADRPAERRRDQQPPRPRPTGRLTALHPVDETDDNAGGQADSRNQPRIRRGRTWRTGGRS